MTILKYLKNNSFSGIISVKSLSYNGVESFIKEIKSFKFSSQENEFFNQVENFFKNKISPEIKTDKQDNKKLTQSSDLAENAKLLEVFQATTKIPFHLTVTTANVTLKFDKPLKSESDFNQTYTEVKRILKIFKFSASLKIYEVRVGRVLIEKEKFTTEVLIDLIREKENVKIIFKTRDLSRKRKKIPKLEDQSFLKKITKTLKNVINAKK